MHKTITLIIITLSAFTAITGCIIATPCTRSVTTAECTQAGTPSRTIHDIAPVESELPENAEFISRALEIHFRAPSSGTAYYIEEHTNIAVYTRSLPIGDYHSFQRAMGTQALDTAFNNDIDLTDATFGLYFAPAE
ncbi:MAG: hypothetical protein JW936_11175 [Sedimentisphaerales bacterium]|nr:hypothetical protein [Sedimentisphaerales bacterium]